MNCESYEDFSYFFRENKPEQEILAEEILSAVECEKIFLLAATISSHHVVNVFTSRPIATKRISHYHVLVVVPRAGKSPNMEMQDKIEGKLQHSIPTTAIVLDTEQFTDWIKEGHPFALTLVKGNSLVYTRKEMEMEEFERACDKEQRNKIESVFAQGQNKAVEFLAGADLYRIREQNKMAAFMLHQSLEQILRSLLLLLTGLEIATHSLDKLLRFCSMFYHRFSEIFKSSDGKSEKLFQLLQKAYINARYKDDYHTHTADLLFLEEKIRTILNIYEKIAKEFLK